MGTPGMSPVIRASDLNRRITIQQATETVDDYGNVQQMWSDLAASVPAKVEQGSGREYYRAARVNAEISAVFMIRWRAGIAPQHRILYDGQIYDIASVAEPADARPREALLIAATARLR